MARADRGDGDGDAEAEDGRHSTASDARLTQLLRTDTATAYPALRELRTRHRPAVLGYARLCTVDDAAARRLTAQAFALAARDTARGSDPRGPWRHQLLLLAGRVAASWAADERAARLDPDLLAHLGAAGSRAQVPPLLAAFQSLPSRVQGVVWYAVVEGEPDDRTADFVGLTREDVTYGTEPAFQSLRQSCLTTRLAASDDPRCQDFRRLIEESVRPDNPRYSADLHAHMVHCVYCATAYDELSALRDDPRTALAAGLLAWGGAAYVTGGAVTRRAVAGGPGPSGPGPGDPGPGPAPGWWPSRRFVLASTALGVALIPFLAYLLVSGGPEPERAANAVATPSRPPAVTVTATVSATPSPSPSHTAGKSPKPSRSPSASKTTRPPSPKPSPKPPAPHPPNGSFAQVVNADSGLCLDIRDGVMDLGTDVVTAPAPRPARSAGGSTPREASSSRPRTRTSAWTAAAPRTGGSASGSAARCTGATAGTCASRSTRRGSSARPSPRTTRSPRTGTRCSWCRPRAAPHSDGGRGRPETRPAFAPVTQALVDRTAV